MTISLYNQRLLYECYKEYSHWLTSYSVVNGNFVHLATKWQEVMKLKNQHERLQLLVTNKHQTSDSEISKGVGSIRAEEQRNVDDPTALSVNDLANKSISTLLIIIITYAFPPGCRIVISEALAKMANTSIWNPQAPNGPSNMGTLINITSPKASNTSKVAE